MAHSGVYVRYGKDRAKNTDKTSGSETVMTVRDVRERLNCSKTQVYDMITSGKLPAFKVGEKKGLRVYGRDVDRIMAEQMESV